MTLPALRGHSVARQYFFNHLPTQGTRAPWRSGQRQGWGKECKDEPEHLVGQAGRKPSLEEDVKEGPGSQTGKRRGALRPKQGPLGQRDSDCAGLYPADKINTQTSSLA